MFTWNHRVLKDSEGMLRFVEMHYDEDTQQPSGYSDPFMCGDNMDEMKELVDRLQRALRLPVIDETTLPAQVTGEPTT